MDKTLINTAKEMLSTGTRLTEMAESLFEIAVTEAVTSEDRTTMLELAIQLPFCNAKLRLLGEYRMRFHDFSNY